MRNLVFVRARGGTIFEPKDVENVFIDNEQGAVCRGQQIVKSYKKSADKSEYSMINIRKEDIQDASAALNWASNGSFEFPINPSNAGLPQADGTLEAEVPGRFSPTISSNDISLIIQDWKTLSPHYPKFQDIFRSGHMNQKFLESYLDFLLNTQTEIISFLSERAGPEIKKQLKAITLPPWIKRVAELRKANN